jgi:antitoxin VapB
MAQMRKARVFMTGRSQAVRIPAEFRFNTSEVYVHRDEQTGDVILSQVPKSWEEIFEEIDKAGFPPEFMADRNQGIMEKREEL